MKHLKKWKLFEDITSSDLENSDIKEICKKYGISNYTINKDGSIDVDDSYVDLEATGLTKLPLKFNRVRGGFYCSNNKLTSLEGAPLSVGGEFDCSNNKLTSLKGAPKEINGNFNCNDNKLTSLEGSPLSTGSFRCYNNKLISLSGAPNLVDGEFDCENNKLTSLEGSPKEVDGDFICINNKLINFKGTPNSIGGKFNCTNNNIKSLDGLELKYIKKAIILEENPIFPIVNNWINNRNYYELIEYFVDLNIIQGDRLSKERLLAFYSEMDLLGLKDSDYEVF